MTVSDAIDSAIRPEALELLIAEIQRYLDAVEIFRSEGREPRWRSEAPLEVTS